MIDYAKEKESAILFEFENQGLNSKLKMLQQLASELGYDIKPNKNRAIPLFIDSNGQFALL
ncbi:hypothetical protein [Fictibacillus phosphorivorans]|nr:hypothetical protein [Fictibacillus phosphorivorans]